MGRGFVEMYTDQGMCHGSRGDVAWRPGEVRDCRAPVIKACSAAVQTCALVCILLMKVVLMCTRTQGHLHPLAGGHATL